MRVPTRYMNIRLLYIADCPHMLPALRLLRAVMRECGIAEESLQIVEVRNREEAEQCQFLGSPTIQVDSADIEVGRRYDSPVFGCRVYQSEGGIAGVPSIEMIVSAICGARPHITRLPSIDNGGCR